MKLKLKLSTPLGPAVQAVREGRLQVTLQGGGISAAVVQRETRRITGRRVLVTLIRTTDDSAVFGLRYPATPAQAWLRTARAKWQGRPRDRPAAQGFDA